MRIILIIILLLNIKSGEAVQNSIIDECSFYENVLEKKYPCGTSGYAVGYGGKYCRAFAAREKDFTEKGNKWRIGTMRCLINSLRKLLLDDGDDRALNCQSIKEFGFDSHPTCYTAGNPSFCELNPKDYTTVLKVIKKKDLFNKLGRKQIARVARICLKNKITINDLGLASSFVQNYSTEKIRLLEEIADLE